MGHTSKVVKVGGHFVGLWRRPGCALDQFGDTRILNDFDRGLLFQACTMTMVALGLNLIYGFNGQFSLGQWGFYGIGAYTAADITYRWTSRDARGLLVAGIGVVLGGLMIVAVRRLVGRYKGMPVLSQFTLYLIGSVAAGGSCGGHRQRDQSRARRPSSARTMPPASWRIRSYCRWSSSSLS